MFTEDVADTGQPKPSAIVTTIDRITEATGVLSALALLVMTCIVCFEIFSRYVLNEPTYWGSDIATYLLVGMTFLGLAKAQRSGDHVQVELLITNINGESRRGLEHLTNWLGLTFVLFTGWQMAAFNWSEYVNGTRDWGLLGTPQWIPELFVTLGYIAFFWSILADIFRDSIASRAREIGVVLLFLALFLLLLALGDRPVAIAKLRVDLGSAAIVTAVLGACLLLNGPRLCGVLAAIIVGSGTVFWLASGAGLLVQSLLLVGCLFALLILGVRVALTLGLVGLLGLIFLMPRPQLSLLAERSWNSVNTFTLTAVPMFVLMGALLIRSGVTRELFDSLTRWFGRTPGGIAHATVGASAVFAAVSGSSLATAATMGKVACPEMISRGYSTRLTYGVVAAGATLGILIPPSIAMIIYGTTVGVPVTQLFVAGVVPGLLLSLGFMACVTAWSFFQPAATPRGDSYSMKEKLRGSLSVLPFILVIVAVLGSLYAGVATPSEAGGVGVAASLVICLARGMLTWRALYDTAIETVRITSFLLLIVVGAAIMSWVFDFMRIPKTLVSVFSAAELSPWLVVTIIAAIYVLLGMFIESISMMLMTLPVTFPLMMSIGVDPLWFGVFLVIMIELGLVTPPVGIILFILRGVSSDSPPMREIVYGVMPFVAVIVAFLALIYTVPEIVLWLPHQLE
ncbi:TRAP transporter large permease subunit [Puniceibacterium sp. IMCC21224]|uniref:TRAP transporter large permease n=1 Tax=Puniceibacterium sp. IMCC21224 TaxID=1618204 RepID=UPI00065D2597|nr:TRAP transporter large permease subunit [Puniceibacterium sp. IMCC21224]KMK64845.1 TRAP transporter, DctM subunit [Puniceibacterium sp. IMCC21224]